METPFSRITMYVRLQAVFGKHEGSKTGVAFSYIQTHPKVSVEVDGAISTNFDAQHEMKSSYFGNQKCSISTVVQDLGQYFVPKSGETVVEQEKEEHLNELLNSAYVKVLKDTDSPFGENSSRVYLGFTFTGGNPRYQWSLYSKNGARKKEFLCVVGGKVVEREKSKIAENADNDQYPFMEIILPYADVEHYMNKINRINPKVGPTNKDRPLTIITTELVKGRITYFSPVSFLRYAKPNQRANCRIRFLRNPHYQKNQNFQNAFYLEAIEDIPRGGELLLERSFEFDEDWEAYNASVMGQDRPKKVVSKRSKDRLKEKAKQSGTKDLTATTSGSRVTRNQSRLERLNQAIEENRVVETRSKRSRVPQSPPPQTEQVLDQRSPEIEQDPKRVHLEKNADGRSRQRTLGTRLLTTIQEGDEPGTDYVDAWLDTSDPNAERPMTPIGARDGDSRAGSQPPTPSGGVSRPKSNRGGPFRQNLRLGVLSNRKPGPIVHGSSPQHDSEETDWEDIENFSPMAFLGDPSKITFKTFQDEEVGSNGSVRSNNQQSRPIRRLSVAASTSSSKASTAKKILLDYIKQVRERESAALGRGTVPVNNARAPDMQGTTEVLTETPVEFSVSGAANRLSGSSHETRRGSSEESPTKSSATGNNGTENAHQDGAGLKIAVRLVNQGNPGGSNLQDQSSGQQGENQCTPCLSYLKFLELDPPKYFETAYWNYLATDWPSRFLVDGIPLLRQHEQFTQAYGGLYEVQKIANHPEIVSAPAFGLPICHDANGLLRIGVVFIDTKMALEEEDFNRFYHDNNLHPVVAFSIKQTMIREQKRREHMLRGTVEENLDVLHHVMTHRYECARVLKVKNPTEAKICQLLYNLRKDVTEKILSKTCRGAAVYISYFFSVYYGFQAVLHGHAKGQERFTDIFRLVNLYLGSRLGSGEILKLIHFWNGDTGACLPRPLKSISLSSVQLFPTVVGLKATNNQCVKNLKLFNQGLVNEVRCSKESIALINIPSFLTRHNRRLRKINSDTNEREEQQPMPCFVLTGDKRKCAAVVNSKSNNFMLKTTKPSPKPKVVGLHVKAGYDLHFIPKLARLDQEVQRFMNLLEAFTPLGSFFVSSNYSPDGVTINSNLDSALDIVVQTINEVKASKFVFAVSTPDGDATSFMLGTEAAFRTEYMFIKNKIASQAPSVEFMMILSNHGQGVDAVRSVHYSTDCNCQPVIGPAAARGTLFGFSELGSFGGSFLSQKGFDLGPWITYVRKLKELDKSASDYCVTQEAALLEYDLFREIAEGQLQQQSHFYVDENGHQTDVAQAMVSLPFLSCSTSVTCEDKLKPSGYPGGALQNRPRCRSAPPVPVHTMLDNRRLGIPAPPKSVIASNLDKQQCENQNLSSAALQTEPARVTTRSRAKRLEISNRPHSSGQSNTAAEPSSPPQVHVVAQISESGLQNDELVRKSEQEMSNLAPFLDRVQFVYEDPIQKIGLKISLPKEVSDHFEKIYWEEPKLRIKRNGILQEVVLETLDIRSLWDREWLTDACLMAYAGLIMARSQQMPAAFHQMLILPPYLYEDVVYANGDCIIPAYMESGEKFILETLRSVDVRIAYPVNRDNNHWVVYVYCPSRGRIDFYDSLDGVVRKTELKNLRTFLGRVYSLMKQKHLISEVEIPDVANATCGKGQMLGAQKNYHDCGIAVCEILEQVAAKQYRPQVHADLLERDFRHLMFLEIATKTLVPRHYRGQTTQMAFSFE